MPVLPPSDLPERWWGMPIYGPDDRDDALDADDPDDTFPDVRNDPVLVHEDDPQPVEEPEE